MLLQEVGSCSLVPAVLHQAVWEDSFKFFLLYFEKGSVGNYFFSLYFFFFFPFIEELVGYIIEVIISGEA